MNLRKSSMVDHTLSNLGLAFRAGAIVTGDQLLKALKQNQVCYLFIAHDASEKTKIRFMKSATSKQIAVNLEYSFTELSQAIGKKQRKVLGLTDTRFLKTLRKKEEQDVTKEKK